MNTQIIAIANQKGGYVPVAHVQHRPERERRSVGKTTTCGSFAGGADEMMIARKILKLLLMIAVAPIVVALTLFVWICLGLVYVSGLVLGLISMILALLGVAVLSTYSPQNGFILLLMAFLISPMGLPLAAIWLLGKVQSLKYAIQDRVYG